MFDFIGDIHGHYDNLVKLLEKLGYQEKEEYLWTHPQGRKIIFLGDLIDRGPSQRKVVKLVRTTCEKGGSKCIMGNHEYNAVCWQIKSQHQEGQYLYQRNSKNRKMHESFIHEYEDDMDAYFSDLKWFKSLPIAIEEEGFRAVHACWNKQYIFASKQYLNEDMSIPDFAWQLTKNKNHPLYLIIEEILKGPEVEIPKEIRKIESDGSERKMIRLAWWPTENENANKILVTTKSHKEILPDEDLNLTNGRLIYNEEKPVFFGHYWLTGEPRVISDKVACLDYSAGSKGPIVAYRWDGEQSLSNDKIFYCLNE